MSIVSIEEWSLEYTSFPKLSVISISHAKDIVTFLNKSSRLSDWTHSGIENQLHPPPIRFLK